MTDDPIKRRNEVYEALQQTTDQKTLQNCTEEALAQAKKAYNTATQSPKLWNPWPQIAAYRLAHLMLRNKNADSHLEEIERLLIEAADANRTLGPLPLIYRLVVLHRLSNLNSKISKKTEEAFHEACEALRDNAISKQEDWDDIVDSGLLGKTKGGPIQKAVFNLLELSTYFLGYPYDKLEGLGGIIPYKHDARHPNPKAWILVGRDPRISNIQLSRAYATKELKDLERLNPHAVLFQLERQKKGAANQRYITDRHIRKSMTEGRGKPATYDALKMLAMILKKPDISREELQDYMTKEPDKISKTNFRKILSRFSDLFQDFESTYTRNLDAIGYPKDGSSEVFQLPQYPIYGAVQLQCLPSDFWQNCHSGVTEEDA